MNKLILLASILLTLVMATPSNQVWNPALDVQPFRTTHIGIDNYYNQEQDYATDTGLTYGLINGLEVGVDFFYPNAPGPLAFNAKYGWPEKDSLPAFAVGISRVGLVANDPITDFREFYALMGKTFDQIGRLTIGYFNANATVVGSDNTGYIFTWDKDISDKISTYIDYASGTSKISSIFMGASYSFSSKISVLFGIGTFPASGATYVTTQLDIDI